MGIDDWLAGKRHYPYVRGTAWLTVVVAYVTTLVALAGDNTVMSISHIFNFDTLRPWFIFHGLFNDAPWRLEAWRLANSTFALDMLMSWLLFGIGALAGTASRAQLIFGMYAAPLVWACVGALGWIMVSRLTWGRSQRRELAVLLAHALPFAFFTTGQEYPFEMWFYRYHHVSTWALLPWLWWLWLLALAAKDDDKARAVAVASLALFLVTFSDMTIAAWFTAPAFVALPLTRVLMGRQSRGMHVLARRAYRSLLHHGVPMVIATVLAKFASDPILLSKSVLQFSLGTMADTLSNMAGYIEYALEHTPVMLLCWFVFVLIAVAWPLRGMRRWWQGQRFIPAPSPYERSIRTAVALLMPAAIVVPILASVVTGLSEPRHIIGKLTIEFRHLLPTLWLPLFVGWALLPWRALSLKLKALGGGIGVVFATSLAYIAIAQPVWQNLNPFTTPFHKCFEMHATERNWVGGVGGWEYVYILADPETSMERYLPMHPHGTTVGYFSHFNQNADWFRGRVDFILVNDYPHGNRHMPPMDEQAGICHGEREKCPPEVHVIAERISFMQAGETSGILDCMGVRFAMLAEPRDFNIEF